MDDAVLVDALAEVARWDAAAERVEISFGVGKTIWRMWGHGRPLLLLHGGSGSWRHWIRNLGPLLPGRRLLAPDLPGLGESDLPAQPWTLTEVAAIVADGLAPLLSRDEACDVIGFSFGALVAGGLAARLQHRVGTLILVGASGLGMERGDVRLESVRNKAGGDRMTAHRTNLQRLMFADPARIDPQALAIQAWNSDHARLRSVKLSTSSVLLDALRQATARLCAIWGAHDAVAGRTLGDRMALLRRLQPGADVRAIPGAGHWVAYEAADAFNAAATDMLGAG
jgi:pimeloyl-ACP methyl ester carboxylesterase